LEARLLSLPDKLADLKKIASSLRLSTEQSQKNVFFISSNYFLFFFKKKKFRLQ